MSATHPRLKKSIQEREKQTKAILETDKPLSSLEDWGKSQSKEIDLIIYKDGVGYKNGIAIVKETKTETKLQEDKHCSIETFKEQERIRNETKDATKKVKWAEGIAEPKPRKPRKPKVSLQVAEPLQEELAVPIKTQQANTTIDYMNLEHMGETKVIIAKTLQYDYFTIPIEFDANDISIIDRKLYYKNMLVDCKAPNQPSDINSPIEVWVDFKVEDYNYYFQKPIM